MKVLPLPAFKYLFYLALFCMPLALHAGALPAAVEQALAAAEIPHSAVAIQIEPLQGGRAVLSFNAKQLMNPASVMKLVTTYAALQRLGPTYTWNTSAYVDALPLDGVLDGNVYLSGGGDPKLTLEAFWLLLRQLRLHGVREIRGDLVLDRSRYALPTHDPAAFDGAPQRPYNVAPDPLLLSYQALRLQFMPQADGKPLVVADPQFPALELVNLLEPNAASHAACGDWKDTVRVDFGGAPPNLTVMLTGRYPAACGEQSWLFGLPAGVDYVGGVFRQYWTEMGGTLAGSTRSGVLPPTARLLARQESPPLAEVVRDVNKFSNNVMARMVYLSLGAEAGARPVRLANAEAAVRQFWGGLSLPAADLVLENGSGLSRRERLTAASLSRMLQHAWASPLMPEFIASLPIAGLDGTLKKRMNAPPIQGQAHLKSGSLDGVRALAGYVQDARGTRYALVMFVNHAHAERSGPAQEALLRWLIERD